MAVPLQGPAGIFGPSCEALAELCVSQLNKTGLLGRRVEIETIDAGAPPPEIAQTVAKLIDRGRIQALTGWHISSVRSHLVPVMAGRIPYVYTSLYEGGERHPGVFCSGETPPMQIAPALSWLHDQLGVRRWFIVGDDYVWPRRSATAAMSYARALGLQVVGSQFVQLGTEDFAPLVRRLSRSGADGVLMFLVGQDAVAFNRAFAREHMEHRVIRFSPLMEENMLIASGPGAIDEMYVSAGYFRSLSTAGSLDLVGEYTDNFGADAPPLNNQAESCYEGITILASLIRAAQCLDVYCLTAVSEGVGYDGPRGAVELRRGHLQQKVHLARATVADFDVITTLDGGRAEDQVRLLSGVTPLGQVFDRVQTGVAVGLGGVHVQVCVVTVIDRDPHECQPLRVQRRDAPRSTGSRADTAEERRQPPAAACRITRRTSPVGRSRCTDSRIDLERPGG